MFEQSVSGTEKRINKCEEQIAEVVKQLRLAAAQIRNAEKEVLKLM